MARNETERAVNVMRDIQFKFDRLEVRCDGPLVPPPLLPLPLICSSNSSSSSPCVLLDVTLAATQGNRVCFGSLAVQGQKDELEQQVQQMRMSAEMESKASARKVSEARVAAAELEVQVADLKAEVDAMRDQCERAAQLEVTAAEALFPVAPHVWVVGRLECPSELRRLQIERERDSG